MQNEESIISFKTDSLSKFKTCHQFKYYGEINSLDDFVYFLKWSEKNKKDIYILGNGSNTLFTRRKVESLILKNSLPKVIKCISEEENLFEISSNVLVSQVLNQCFKNSLDSFYFLASVPATIGGALAMNAGEAKVKNRTIYDYVDTLTYIDNTGLIKTVKKKDIFLKFRKTMFTGQQNNFIVSATFKFPKKEFNDINPIKERIKWAKIHQDNVEPNCGSVFNENNARIMGWLKGVRVGKAHYSSKTHNWIKNNSKNSLSIIALIVLAKILHIIFRKECKVELIRVK